MKYISKDENDTISIATGLSETLKGGDILCLRGDLGTGKTVFARAIIRHLIDDSGFNVPSPTFSLVQNYETPKAMIRHFDLYRIENTEDIYELGWEEALDTDITIVEWPERLEFLAPDNHLELVFKTLEDNKREITLVPHGTWKERINDQ